MSDMLFDFADSSLDLVCEFGEIQTDESLRSAVLVSLFTDARCEDSEIPLLDKSPRGFWGDAIFQEKTGSKLWLLERAKRNQDTLTRAQSYATDALSWLLVDKLASGINVKTSYTGKDCLQMVITILKPNGKPLSVDIENIWRPVS